MIRSYTLVFFFVLSFLNLSAQINGPSSVCALSNDTFTCSQISATYSWQSNSNTSVIFSDTTIQNPSVSFSNAGTYTITVNTTVPNNSFTYTVTVLPLTSISGTVLSNSVPVTDGIIYLYSTANQGKMYGYLATSNLNSNSQYTLPSVPAGNYILKCYPNTTTYPNLISTYFGGASQWDSAIVINHNCANNFTADINLLENQPLNGTDVISGYLFEAPGYGSKQIHTNLTQSVPGDPIPNIDINLMSSSGIYAQTQTDMTGSFAFNNVPIGTYTIFVDIPGLVMDSTYYLYVAPIVQNPNNNSVFTSFNNLIFFADSNSITPTTPFVGIKNIENNIEAKVYPNPAKNLVSIKTNNSNEITIELVNQLGEILTSKRNANQLNTIELSKVPSGVYFIKITTDNGNSIQKLIVEN